MTDHGILMKGEMVRAYLADRKWMTRRTRGLGKINKNPDAWEFLGFQEIDGIMKAIFRMKSTFEGMTFTPPYGWIGDGLWVKETYAVICRQADLTCQCETEEEEAVNHYVEYRADTDNAYPGDWPEEEARGNDEAPKWKSSMFMPRKYSRISVPVTNCRVERIQDITMADVIAEGVSSVTVSKGVLSDNPPDPRWKFIELWNQINEKRGMGWDINPWVFIYEFPKYSNLEENAVQKGKV